MYYHREGEYGAWFPKYNIYQPGLFMPIPVNYWLYFNNPGYGYWHDFGSTYEIYHAIDENNNVDGDYEIGEWFIGVELYSDRLNKPGLYCICTRYRNSEFLYFNKVGSPNVFIMKKMLLPL